MTDMIVQDHGSIFLLCPQTRRYKCESCGERAVYGAEELLMGIAP